MPRGEELRRAIGRGVRERERLELSPRGGVRRRPPRRRRGGVVFSRASVRRVRPNPRARPTPHVPYVPTILGDVLGVCEFGGGDDVGDDVPRGRDASRDEFFGGGGGGVAVPRGERSATARGDDFATVDADETTERVEIIDATVRSSRIGGETRAHDVHRIFFFRRRETRRRYIHAEGREKTNRRHRVARRREGRRGRIRGRIRGRT